MQAWLRFTDSVQENLQILARVTPQQKLLKNITVSDTIILSLYLKDVLDAMAKIEELTGKMLYPKGRFRV